MKQNIRRIITSLLALVLALTLPAPALADTAKGSTLRLASFAGTVTMANASGKSVTPRKDLRLYNGYTTATAKSSNAYISLDGTKAVKLDASGKVKVQQSGKQLEVHLVSGKLFFNVTAPLDANESFQIRSGTMVTGIRGSFGWVAGTEMGLMHGHITLTCTNPETGEVRTTEVYSGEMVYFDPEASDTDTDEELRKIDFVKRPITNEDVPAVVVEEMREDEVMQEQVAADVETIDVPALLDSLEEKRAEETAAEETAEAEVTAAQTAQAEAIAEGEAESVAYFFGEIPTQTPESTPEPTSEPTTTPVATAAPAPGETAAPPITTAATDTAALQELLNGYADVTLTASGTYSDVTVPYGTTLTIASGATFTNAGTLTNYGTLNNYSADTIINAGTLNNYGTLNNGDGGSRPGRLVNSDGASVYNYGTVTNNAGSAVMISGAFYNCGTFTNLGAVTVDAGGTFINGLDGRSGRLVSSGAFDCYGAFVNNAGSEIINNGTFTLYAWDGGGSHGTLTGGGSFSGVSVVTVTTYVVDFDIGGTVAHSEYVPGSGTAAAYAPVRNGFTLDGWYTDAALTVKYDFSAPVEKNLTLYARWVETVPGGSGVCGEDLTWELAGGVLTISGTGPMEDYTYMDSRYDTPWYDVRASIVSVAISDGVTGIGTGAFYGCVGLTDVTVPASVLSVGYAAFGGCAALTDVYYGGTEALWAKVEIGDGNAPLLSAAMHYGGATVTYTITFVDEDGKTILDEQSVAAGETPVYGGAAPAKAATAERSYTFAGWTPEPVPATEDATYTAVYTAAPRVYTVTLNANGGTVSSGNITRYTYGAGAALPADVTREGYVFAGWYAARDLSGEPVTAIGATDTGNKIFYARWTEEGGGIVDSGACGGDVRWTLRGDGLLRISGTGPMDSYSAASGTPWYDHRASISSVVIEDGVTGIGERAFEHCASLTSVSLPNSVTSIETWAFAFCDALTDVTIPAGVTLIEAGAFLSCAKLRRIDVDSGNPSYVSVDGVLYDKGMTRLICYPKGKGASYLIPEGVTGIGAFGFGRCDALTGVTIPAGVISIGEYAFYECTALTDVYYGGTEAQWDEITIGGGNGPLTGATLHCGS